MTLIHFSTTLFRAAQSRILSIGIVVCVLGALLSSCGGGAGVDSEKTINTLPDLLVSAPVAPSGVDVGVEVHFGGGVCIGGNSNLTTTWSFGDGSNNTSIGVHTYLGVGIYQVRVDCNDTSGLTAPASTFVTVLPVISTPVAPQNVGVGVEARFGGGECFGGNSNLTTNWSFGDVSNQTSSGVHTYLAAGTYQVRVECIDAPSGVTKSASINVTVL